MPETDPDRESGTALSFWFRTSLAQCFTTPLRPSPLSPTPPAGVHAPTHETPHRIDAANAGMTLQTTQFPYLIEEDSPSSEEMRTLRWLQRERSTCTPAPARRQTRRRTPTPSTQHPIQVADKEMKGAEAREPRLYPTSLLAPHGRVHSPARVPPSANPNPQTGKRTRRQKKELSMPNADARTHARTHAHLAHIHPSFRCFPSGLQTTPANLRRRSPRLETKQNRPPPGTPDRPTNRIRSAASGARREVGWDCEWGGEEREKERVRKEGGTEGRPIRGKPRGRAEGKADAQDCENGTQDAECGEDGLCDGKEDERGCAVYKYFLEREWTSVHLENPPRSEDVHDAPRSDGRERVNNIAMSRKVDQNGVQTAQRSEELSQRASLGGESRRRRREQEVAAQPRCDSAIFGPKPDPFHQLAFASFPLVRVPQQYFAQAEIQAPWTLAPKRNKFQCRLSLYWSSLE
ncbi:hypothetical protein K438DRAFT_1765269 [Mycena galopus ATCC 62051]|nr:hypothetical protein K438DRAFT_1765269 [Mycena galopus ATCC 62051]